MGGKSKSKTTSATVTPTNYNNIQGNEAPVTLSNVTLNTGYKSSGNSIHLNNTITDHGAINAAGRAVSRSLDTADNSIDMAEKTSLMSLQIMDRTLSNTFAGAKEYAEQVSKDAFDFATQATAPDAERTKDMVKYGAIAVTLMITVPFIARRF